MSRTAHRRDGFPTKRMSSGFRGGQLQWIFDDTEDFDRSSPAAAAAASGRRPTLSRRAGSTLNICSAAIHMARTLRLRQTRDISSWDADRTLDDKAEGQKVASTRGADAGRQLGGGKVPTQISYRASQTPPTRRVADVVGPDASFERCSSGAMTNTRTMSDTGRPSTSPTRRSTPTRAGGRLGGRKRPFLNFHRPIKKAFHRP